MTKWGKLILKKLGDAEHIKISFVDHRGLIIIIPWFVTLGSDDGYDEYRFTIGTDFAADKDWLHPFIYVSVNTNIYKKKQKKKIGTESIQIKLTKADYSKAEWEQIQKKATNIFHKLRKKDEEQGKIEEKREKEEVYGRLLK